MTIKNLPYSFMQFEPISKADYILPVFQENETWFSILVTGADFYEAQEIYYAPNTEMQLLLLRGYDNNPASVTPQTLRNYGTADGLYFQKFKVSDLEVLYVWKNDLKHVIVNSPLIECGECFQLGLLFRGVTLVSNPLKKLCDERDTSVITYYGEDNSFKFYYCGTTAQNKVRVPAVLQKPQLNTEENIYVRSDGSRQVTKSLKSKQFACAVDFSYIAFHEKLDIALSHDFVNIRSRDYIGPVVKTGNYAIDWEASINRDFAQAECQLIVTPFDARNTNCGFCSECSPVTISDLTLKNGMPGDPYNDQIPILGDAPFRIDEVVKPDWVTIELVGDLVYIMGTPSELGTNDISFKLYNCFGIQSFEYASEIEIITPAAPTGLVVSDITQTTALLSWDDMDASSYDIYLWEFVPGGIDIPQPGYPKNSILNSYSFSGLNHGTGYQISVVANYNGVSSTGSSIGNPDFVTLS